MYGLAHSLPPTKKPPFQALELLSITRANTDSQIAVTKLLIRHADLIGPSTSKHNMLSESKKEVEAAGGVTPRPRAIRRSNASVSGGGGRRVVCSGGSRFKAHDGSHHHQQQQQECAGSSGAEVLSKKSKVGVGFWDVWTFQKSPHT
jgi:hypothetical protein